MLVLMSMLMPHTILHFFVLSFVLACAYAFIASKDQTLGGFQIAYNKH